MRSHIEILYRVQKQLCDYDISSQVNEAPRAATIDHPFSYIAVWVENQQQLTVVKEFAQRYQLDVKRLCDLCGDFQLTLV